MRVVNEASSPSSVTNARCPPKTQNIFGDFCNILLGIIDVNFCFSNCVKQSSDTSLYFEILLELPNMLKKNCNLNEEKAHNYGKLGVGRKPAIWIGGGGSVWMVSLTQCSRN